MSDIFPYDVICVDDAEPPLWLMHKTPHVRFGQRYEIAEHHGELVLLVVGADTPQPLVAAARLRRPDEIPAWAAKEIVRLRERFAEISALLRAVSGRSLVMDSSHYSEGGSGEFIDNSRFEAL